MLSFDIELLQDQNLNPIQLELSSHSFQTVCIKNRGETFVEVESSSTIGELRGKYCQSKHLDVLRIRFLFNGERLEDKDLIITIGLKEGENIEAFEECRGGGPPGKKGILDSEDKIIEALSANSDNDDTTSESSSDESQCESTLTSSVKSKMTIKHQFKEDVCESEIIDIRKDPVDEGKALIAESMLESQRDIVIHSLVEELRNEFKIGNLTVKNPLHMQIWFYLQLQNDPLRPSPG